ncbi:stage II sporulation protein P [Paenibacillus sp. NFR01]|uniref:stage II sporulation protein P n=1 Tax=Paenibacillus sp. NFR01 TaxID=1566279 RepID=UPI0008D3482F|nr:stage II sporulation protein P [Paenibacillus sp. NFR01]SET66841.1 stage II sporulation protein P [Paenibacillus sp. NFR01]
MNRKWFRLWNIGRARGKLLDVLALGRTLLVLAGGSLVFFMLLGAGGIAGQKLNSSPAPSMKGLAASLSSGFFMELLGMELPHLPKGEQPSSFSGQKVTSFVFRLLTSVDPGDPKTLLSREVPGLAADDPFLVRSGSGGGTDSAPADYHPGASETAAGTDKPADSGAAPGGGAADPGQAAGGLAEGGEPAGGTQADAPQGTAAPDAGGGGDSGAGEAPGKSSGTGTGAADGGGSTAEPGGAAGDKDTSVKRILIYHSHPREAYNPLLGVQSDNPSSADPGKNVMLVGSYVSKRLEQLGIGTVHAEEDYATKETDYNWNFSYKYSRITVKAAMAAHEGMTELIDIHRDSQRHGKTTAVIDGKSYAQVYLILGYANKNWKKNEAFANQIHNELEKHYPGLSRGIWGKASGNGNNGEYNQTLSPNSVLIEVGGIDNTEEELKRTAEVLADAIAEVYWNSHDAEKADASASGAN